MEQPKKIQTKVNNMFKLKLLVISMVFIAGYSNADNLQNLPTQPVNMVKTEAITPINKATDLLTNKDMKLSNIEKSNIKEIYDQKIKNPQFELGVRYYFGTHGLDQDYNKAVYWLANSSQDEENPSADMMIASMYYEGKGFPQNTEKAVSFYTRAANRNSLEAQLILTSIFFFNSTYMNQEYANYWIYKAIENKGRQADLLKSLILLKEEDYNTIQKMIPAYEKYAEYGNEFAQFTLGYLYFTGKVVKQDFSRSIKYLSLSAVNKNPISIIMIDEINRLMGIEQKEEIKKVPEELTINPLNIPENKEKPKVVLENNK